MWLRKTAGRIAIDQWRRSGIQQRLVLERAITAQGSASGALDMADEAERIWIAFRTISDLQRAVLLAKVVDELTFEQIAGQLQIAVPTAKTHYRRAIEKLRARLGAPSTPSPAPVREICHAS